MFPHHICLNIDILAIMNDQKNAFGFHSNWQNQGRKHQSKNICFRYKVCQIEWRYFNILSLGCLSTNATVTSTNSEIFSFWAAAPKGRCPVGQREYFWTSVCPSIHPYIHSPQTTQAPLRPQISPLKHQTRPLSPKISPLRFKMGPPKPIVSPQMHF